MKDIRCICQEIKEKTQNIKWIEVISIAIFGSVARQENNTNSDLDLLVIADGIPQKKIHRINDIVNIKRTLDLAFPVDILLVSKEECEANFRNHNPLYLDIAIDAKIACDTGFLSSLMEETRQYIDLNHIRRGVNSWSFPVKDRIATPLSSITNREWAIIWLQDAKRDLMAASHLLDISLYEKSVYHSQQAVEKAIKAILAVWGEFNKTHFVANTLRRECNKQKLDEWKEMLLDIANVGDRTEPHVSLSRYPSVTKTTLWIPSEEYDVDSAREYLNGAEFVIKTSEEFIEWWFR